MAAASSAALLLVMCSWPVAAAVSSARTVRSFGSSSGGSSRLGFLARELQQLLCPRQLLQHAQGRGSRLHRACLVCTPRTWSCVRCMCWYDAPPGLAQPHSSHSGVSMHLIWTTAHPEGLPWGDAGWHACKLLGAGGHAECKQSAEGTLVCYMGCLSTIHTVTHRDSEASHQHAHMHTKSC